MSRRSPSGHTLARRCGGIVEADKQDPWDCGSRQSRACPRLPASLDKTCFNHFYGWFRRTTNHRFDLLRAMICLMQSPLLGMSRDLNVAAPHLVKRSAQSTLRSEV